MNQKDLEYLLNHQNFALIGMNDDPKRYAYKIFFKLIEKNKNVYGVNPKYDSIKGHPIFNSLEEIERDIDAVIFLVNPKIGIHYLETIKNQGIKTIWLQPGTMSDELIEKAKTLDLNIIENCVLALYDNHTEIKAVICDLDETLLGEDKTVSSKNIEAIQMIRDKGIYFIPATGRPYYSIKETLDVLNLYDEKDYSISYNGGMIHHNKQDKSLKFHGLDFAIVNELFHIGEAVKVSMHIYLENETVAFNLNDEEKQRLENFPNLIVSEKTNIDFLKDAKILKILYQDLDLDYLKSLEAKVSDELRKDLEISYSSNRYLEFNPKGVTKGLAVEELAEILDLKMDEILSIGDNDNDLSMLKITGKSGAPYNAVKPVKEMVDYVSLYDHNESSVADIIKHFI
ncbi:MAG TPA: Cof-type HAD-IIB family hydrolase [Erysipelothrix sp.]|nr:Cof-type HAD-IIB family hydrolase [Erysipelothrix sp.]